MARAGPRLSFTPGFRSSGQGRLLSKVFFADFKKGFDLIDHHILMEKLSTQYNLHWSLLRWVAPFLKGRAQVTRVGASVSAPLYLNGGIPQGTKLGPVLLACSKLGYPHYIRG